MLPIIREIRRSDPTLTLDGIAAALNRPPMRCGQSATSICPTWRRSSRSAAMGGIDKCLLSLWRSMAT
jgi:hypothetical protein